MNERRAENVIFPIMISLYAIVLVGVFFAQSRNGLWDDAYFFKRFAHNLFAYGSLSWNPSDGPVYGLTSQLFLVPVLIVYKIAQSYYILLIKIFLSLCLLFAFFFILRFDRNRAYPGRYLFLFAAFCSPIVLVTAVTGMETALVLSLLAAFYFYLFAETDSRKFWLLPMLTLAIYLARPDAALMPFVAFVLYYHRDRRTVFRLLFFSGLAILAALFALKIYYGTYLPLSFYVKSLALSPYGKHFMHLAQKDKVRHLLQFFYYALPFIFVSLYSRDRRVLTLLTSAGLFIAYHALQTVEVMGMMSRFYLPSFIPIILAAAIAYVDKSSRTLLALLLLYVGVGVLFRCMHILQSVSIFALGLYWIVLSVQLFHLETRRVVFLFVVLSLLGLSRVAPTLALSLQSDAAIVDEQIEHYTVWRGLKTLRAAFPQPIVIFHSEIGVPGILFPDSRIVDEVGLMNPAIVFHDRTIAELCEQERPEAIFLPHRHYRRLNEQMQQSQCLRDYRLVVAQSSSPLYIRADRAEIFRSFCVQQPRSVRSLLCDAHECTR